MNKEIEKIKNFRGFLLNQIGGLSAEQLNKIPTGYANNIIWNVAHLIAAEQSMCYVRSGLAIVVDDRYYLPFMPTTKPERFIDQPEIDIIKKLFITSIDTLQSDFDKNIFVNYSPSAMIPKIYGVEVITLTMPSTFYSTTKDCMVVILLRKSIFYKL